MKTAILLIERQGGVVKGISVFFAEKNEETLNLFDNYSLKTIGMENT